MLLSIFHMIIGHLYTFCKEVSIKIFCTFLIRLFVFLLLSWKSLIYAKYKSFIRYIICEHFSHSVGYLLFSWWCPLKPKSIQFWLIQICLFFLVSRLFDVISKIAFTKPRVMKIYAHIFFYEVYSFSSYI